MINKDRSETLVYNNAAHPFFLKMGALGPEQNYAFLSHWHDELEFIIVTEGKMRYYVNGKNVSLDVGDGFFINTRRLHSSLSPDNVGCKYICFLIHPTLLCASAYIEEKYVQPVLNGGLDFMVLHKDDPDAGRVLDIIREAYELSYKPDFELTVQKSIFDLWYEVYKLTDFSPRAAAPQSYHLSALKDMIEYINKHYSEKVTLEQIGRAGGFGETSCCRIFKKYTNKTPLGFLIDHRLQKGVELLLSTDMTVTEISNSTGFSSPSYFSEMFKKSYGCSPREYKLNNCK